jgi:hypothetical protein
MSQGKQRKPTQATPPDGAVPAKPQVSAVHVPLNKQVQEHYKRQIISLVGLGFVFQVLPPYGCRI